MKYRSQSWSLRVKTLTKLLLAFCLSFQSSFIAANPEIRSTTQEVKNLFEQSQPYTVWDQKADRTAGEIEQQWSEALRRHQDQVFSNHVPDIEKAETFDLWIERLRANAFYGESANSGSGYYANHPLDSFGVLGQTVLTEAVFRDQSSIGSYFAPLTKALKALARGGKAAVNAVGQTTSNMISSTLGSSPMITASADVAEPEVDRSTSEIQWRPYFSYVDWTKLVFELRNSKGEALVQMNPMGSDLSRIHPGTGLRAGEREFNQAQGSSEPLTFDLLYQGQLLHAFKNNVRNVATFGRYLVFLEPNRYNSELGFVNLSFIDLEYFKSAIGKTVLPIFRLPIQVQGPKRGQDFPVNFQVTENGLKVNDQIISNEVFEFYSWMQQLTFNTTVSLVDPRFYQSTEKILESLVQQFDASLTQTAEGMQDQLENAGVSLGLFQSFKDEMSKQLKVRAQIGAKKSEDPREVDRTHQRLSSEALRLIDQELLKLDPLSSSAKVLDQEKRLESFRLNADKLGADAKAQIQRAYQFGQSLQNDASFQRMLQGYNQTIESQSKLSNRLDLLWSKMFQPNPLGAPKIQRALGLVAAGVTSQDALAPNGKTLAQRCAMTKEGILELVANPKSRMALEVATGAALCTLYPAEASQFVFHSLDLGRNLMNGMMGWMDSMTSITKSAWEQSWAFLNPGVLVNAYASTDKFQRLAVGVGALYGALLSLAGSMHILVNGYHYGKALNNGLWQETRKEGLGVFASLKQSFVKYIAGDKQAYLDALSRADKKRRGQLTHIQLSGGNSFKGLFRSSKANDFAALGEAARKNENVKLSLTLPDGRGLEAQSSRDLGGSDSFTVEMDLPDGTRLKQSFTPLKGDWTEVISDEALKSGMGLEIRTGKSTLEGALQNTEWTQAEEASILAFLEGQAKTDSEFSKKFNVVKKIPGISRLFKQGDGSIQTLGQALRHFMFGYSSWTHSTKLFGQIWNPWFIMRNFWLRPRAWLTVMYYPNLFNRAVWNGGIATYFDGGKRPITELNVTQKIYKFAKEFPYYTGVDDELAQLERFEKEVVPVQQVIHAAAIKQAFMALTEMGLKDPDYVRILTQGGDVNPYDPKFRKLGKKLKVFFESYFKFAFEESLRAHLEQTAGTASGLGDKDLKRIVAASKNSIQIGAAEAEELVRLVSERNKIRDRSTKVADEFFSGLWERTKLDHGKKVMRAMDSQFNYSLNRYKTAATQMQNEEAMARATRQYMVGLVVDKPIELLLTFLFIAGVDEGVLKPLHEEAFGPDSAFYVSRYVFWNGYFTGIMISLLADVWMKIQMDSRIDSMGGFDHVPTPEQYKKGFMSYYIHNLKAEDNKWWDNQKLEMKLAFVNMPAYFLTAMVSNLATLGRFDLDSFVSVYKGALLPTGGLAFKLDQGFEKSANFVVGGIDSKFHSDPRIQEFRNQKIGRLRLAYNFMYKTFFENPLGNLIMNWMTVPVEGIGPRAWMRVWYPNEMLPTELVVNYGTQPLQNMTPKGSFVNNMALSCESLLTTNHTDAIKLKPGVAR